MSDSYRQSIICPEGRRGYKKAEGLTLLFSIYTLWHFGLCTTGCHQVSFYKDKTFKQSNLYKARYTRWFTFHCVCYRIFWLSHGKVLEIVMKDELFIFSHKKAIVLFLQQRIEALPDDKWLPLVGYLADLNKTNALMCLFKVHINILAKCAKIADFFQR